MTISFGVNAATPVKFMGIPVHGTVPEMARQLERKGFENLGENWFRGYFGGELALVSILAMENRVVAISVWYLCESVDDLVAKYNKLYYKIIMKDNYYYVKGRQITTKDLPHKAHIDAEELKTIFYQIAYKSEKVADCESRHVELNVYRPNGRDDWFVTLVYANMEGFDDDY